MPHLIGAGGVFTTQMVNEELEVPGWGPEALDETGFQLIVYIPESEFDYKVSHYRDSREKKGLKQRRSTHVL